MKMETMETVLIIAAVITGILLIMSGGNVAGFVVTSIKNVFAGLGL